MRSIWKGTISFGLVSIPVALFRATKDEELSFRLLRKSDLSPVNYKRVAEADGKEVPWEQIVKGYEYKKGKFVILQEEDFKRVDIEATQTVDIIHFVHVEEINPMFFQKPYYMEPQKGGDKAYALLREALSKSDKVGIAKVVIKTRQYLAAVKPRRDLLVLELMHFADELMDADELRAPKKMPPTSQEVAVAGELIENMTAPWKPEEYTDDYRDALLRLINQKARKGGKSVETAVVEKKQDTTKIIDLVEVLRRSIKETQKNGKRARKAA
jgi:DNA end-binding protein Ku